MSFVVKRRTEPIVYSMPVGGLVYYIPLKTDFVEKIKNATVVKTGTCTVGVDGFVANGASGLVYNIPELNVMTVSFCLKATANPPTTHNAYVVAWTSSILMYYHNSYGYMNYYRSIGYSGLSTYKPLFNTYTNILCTMDGTTCNYYQDGVKVGSRTSGGAALNNKGIYIAAKESPTVYLNNAIIKHVRIWNRVLTPSEMLTVKDNDNPN